jgi:hypothetical protein
VITSALDMVQDTAWALETYATEVDWLDEDKPHAYIRIFGVLNGLVIQQDAAYLLFRALGAPKAAGGFAAFRRLGILDPRSCQSTAKLNRGRRPSRRVGRKAW